MLTKEEIRGRWNEVKGRLQEHWGQLSDADLQRAQGTANELVGMIQEKTGASRRDIESFLSRIVEDSESMTHRASEAASQYSEAAQQYAEEAAQLARQGLDRVTTVSNDLSRKVVHTVRQRPAESLAIAFGVGVLAGAVMLLGRRGR